MTDGIGTKLLRGLAALLAGDGVVTYAGTGPVDPAATLPNVFLNLYPETPDLVCALTCYAAGADEPTLSGSVLMVQVRTRSSDADFTSGDNLDDAIWSALAGRYPVQLATGVILSTITRTSGGPIGRDAAGRLERTTNYRCVVHDPGPHRG